MPSPPTRRFVGPYRIIALIGVGASSTVYRAVRPTDDLQVAIKVLADNHSVLAESRRRFTDEWKALAKFDHQAITTIFEVGETESGQPYIVLELANRGDLQARVDRLGAEDYQLTSGDISAVAEHLHDALGELHRQGVVHRDVSPANILIRSDNPASAAPFRMTNSLLNPSERFLLTDLGFSKRMADASGLTRGGGTMGFAAPEQRNAVAIVDHRVDLFSASAVVSWLASGTSSEVSLSRFVETGMSVDPDDRHQNIDEWFNEFRAALATGNETKLGDRVAQGRDQHSRIGSKRRRSRLIVIAAVAGLAATIGVTVSLWSQRQSNQSPEQATVVDSMPDGDTPQAVTSQPTGALVVPPSTGSSTSSLTTAPTASVSEPTASATAISTAPTSDPPVSTSTTSSVDTSTTSNPFPFSPRAYVESPLYGSVVQEDLMIRGIATSPDGVASVELAVKNIDDNTYWDPTANQLQGDFLRFTVPVEPGEGADVVWNYVINRDDLIPGEYRIRVWARGDDGTGDPVGEFVLITISAG